MQYILGDIHANIRELERLLLLLSPRREDTLIFLGDYIDKLPFTQETLALLHRLNSKYHCVFLRGNHEYVWDRYVCGGEKERQGFLLQRGGREALQGFDQSIQNALLQNDMPVLRHALASYFALMTLMKDWHVVNEYIALHAGLLSEQYEEPIVVFQEKNFFLRPADISFERKYLHRHILVAGHTHLGEEPTISGGYINIDLGAGYGKFLGALIVEKRIIIRSDGKEYPLA